MTLSFPAPLMALLVVSLSRLAHHASILGGTLCGMHR